MYGLGMQEIHEHSERTICFSELELWGRGPWEVKQVRIQQVTSGQHVQVCTDDRKDSAWSQQQREELFLCPHFVLLFLSL